MSISGDTPQASATRYTVPGPIRVVLESAPSAETSDGV
jgi:hypothetical protein